MPVGAHCWGYFCSAVNWRRRGLTSPPSSPTGEGLASSDGLASCWNWRSATTIAPCKAEDFISEKRFDRLLAECDGIDLPDEAVRRVSEMH